MIIICGSLSHNISFNDLEGYLFFWDVIFFQESYRLNYPNFTSIKYYYIIEYYQVLLAWKICFHHNFSPHKMLLWNKWLITSRNTFLHKWFERNIYFVIDMLYERGNILSYEDFMHVYNFPIPLK